LDEQRRERRDRKHADRCARPLVRPTALNNSSRRAADAETIEDARAATSCRGARTRRKAAFYAKEVQSSLTCAVPLFGGQDLTEIMKLHSEYVRRRCARAEQAGEMATIVSGGLIDAQA